MAAALSGVPSLRDLGVTVVLRNGNGKAKKKVKQLIERRLHVQGEKPLAEIKGMMLRKM